MKKKPDQPESIFLLNFLFDDDIHEIQKTKEKEFTFNTNTQEF